MGELKGATPLSLVTSSWDDGHPFDLRTAELLKSRGLTGTFYVAVSYQKRPQLSVAQMRELISMGMEIGSHTLSHRLLPQLDTQTVFQELDRSKKELEDQLGIPITSICYPKGKFNRTVCREAARAGYAVGRTTVAFRTSLNFDPLAMPVSCHFVHQPSVKFVRHVIREWNLKGLADWYRLYRTETDPLELASLIFEQVVENGGIFHFWGHSWELDDQALWEEFEELLQRIAHRPQVRYVTNSEVLRFRETETANAAYPIATR